MAELGSLRTSLFKSNLMDVKRSPKHNVLFVWAGIVVVVSFLFALGGPFGTFLTSDFSFRLVFWFGLNFVSVSIALSVNGLIQKYRSHWSCLSRECLVILFTTVLFTPFLWFWIMSMFPNLFFEPPSVWWMGGVVFAICISMSFLKYGLPLVMGIANTPVEKTKVSARITRRLPEDFDGTIIRLSVEGHIVHVVTDVETFELRMRFADAVDEVSEIEGVCTHRSHWVAIRQISKAGTVNNRPCLILSNGDEVPISRKYQPNLEALGII